MLTEILWEVKAAAVNKRIATLTNYYSRSFIPGSHNIVYNNSNLLIGPAIIYLINLNLTIDNIIIIQYVYIKQTERYNMAYVNKKDIQDIRVALKKKYPDFKLSVSKNKHSSTVQIKILSGPLNFWNLKEYSNNLYENDNFNLNGYRINHYHLHFYKEFESFFNDMIKIIKTAASDNQWYDNSDPMTDYFSTAFYISIQIGDSLKPYILTAKKAA